VLDILAVWFELRFGQKPLLLLGVLGAILAVIGVLAGIALLLVPSSRGSDSARCSTSLCAA
jgi:hypothetical protein